MEHSNNILSWFAISCFLTALALTTQHVEAKPSETVLTVHQPFMEIRTGPGRGYPVHQVIEQGEHFIINRQRTDWVNVTATRRHGKTGWSHISNITETTDATGAYASLKDSHNASERDWQWTLSGGQFSDAELISSTLGYHFTPNLSLQLQASQILGSVSDGKLLSMAMQFSPFPDARFSPYTTLGAGVLRTEPFTTLVEAEDRTDNVMIVGVGANVFLGRRFMLTADYRYNTVLTTRNLNEEIHEWKLGLSVFF